MENRLEGQDIQGDELFMDLTPEELKELEQLKGGGLPLDSKYSIFYEELITDIGNKSKKENVPEYIPIYDPNDPDRPFPYGIPARPYINKELNITQDISNQGLGF